MSTSYASSWKLYKAQSESFKDDYDYYYNFCKNHKTLEMFAGYGRLANYLKHREIDIEIVEIEKEFAKYIDLDNSKKHIDNVLTFTSANKFHRIIAGYNSFCLFTKEEDIKQFFTQVSNLMSPDGYASLNYFDTHYWKDAPSGELIIDNEKISYKSSHDLSKAKEGYAVWIDEYEFINSPDSMKKRYEYPVRVYENADALYPFYKHTDLELIDIVENYGLQKDKISEPGWIDYVFKKK